MKTALALGVLALLVSASLLHEVAAARIESPFSHSRSGALNGRAPDLLPDPDPCPGCVATVGNGFVDSTAMATIPDHILNNLPYPSPTDSGEFGDGDCGLAMLGCTPYEACAITGPGGIRWTTTILNPNIRVSWDSDNPPAAGTEWGVEIQPLYLSGGLFAGTKITVWVDTSDLGAAEIACGAQHHFFLHYVDYTTNSAGDKYLIALPFGCSNCPRGYPE